jgi:cation transport regulator ChaB
VLFGVKSHFILAVAVFVIFSAFNIAFQTYFNKHFGKRDLLPEKKAQVKKWSASKRRENKAELERLKVPVDAKFGVYKSAHSQAYKVISVLTCITSFKVNKILYSHFYSFGMFKATWSKEP